jgi:osmotically-inducible protein OsmY
MVPGGQNDGQLCSPIGRVRCREHLLHCVRPHDKSTDGSDRRAVRLPRTNSSSRKCRPPGTGPSTFGPGTQENRTVIVMTSPVTQRDSHLKDAVIAELAWTPNVNASKIGVAVIDGAVTLAGEVLTYPEGEQAERAALRVRGVTAIADEIGGPCPRGYAQRQRHRPPGRGNARPRRRRARRVGESRCAPSCRDISGEVNWQYQRSAAHRAVAYLKGVTAVVNNIRITPKPSAADTKSAITAALIRNARVEARNIDVTASPDGTVTLTGTVNSWHERRQAEHAAWAAPGVSAVDNRLKVRS